MPATVTLQQLQDETDALEQNRLLFDWLSDDALRRDFYDDLEGRGSPVFKVKSVVGSSLADPWPHDDLYVVSGQEHIAAALRDGSVAPYATLESGGAFMLGLDEVDAHTRQRTVASDALHYPDAEIAACVREAWRLAAVLPLKRHTVDVARLAEQVALRFAELLFGVPLVAHVALERLMAGVYRLLTYQIIGRHFVTDRGVRADHPGVVRLRRELDDDIRMVLDGDLQRHRFEGFDGPTVLEKLSGDYGTDQATLLLVAKGLIAGTIGNVQAAVTIAMHGLFTPADAGPRAMEQAIKAARADDGAALKALIEAALLRDPPAPFLARSATPALQSQLRCGKAPVPTGAHLLLLMGVKPTGRSLFGGAADPTPRHHCVGEHLAWPLVVETVRQLLMLPGLAQVIDETSGKPQAPVKRWGAICESYELQYQRDQRLNQQPLFVVLPIKPPIEENARKLLALTAGGACIVEDALDDAPHVHFAWFNIIEGGTCLAMTTVYDGDFDAYVEHFATSVDLFDRQFEYLDVDQPRPVRDHPKAFVETIRRYNRAPLAHYFYSAYPRATVSDIERVGLRESKERP